MEINAFTKGELKGAFIYFIFAKELLYIGETQKIAIARWYSHLYQNGTLLKNIQNHGKNPLEYTNSLHFISIKCNEIQEDFPEIRWKTITQAVEHSIHKVLYMSQISLLQSYYHKYAPDVIRYEIISDTKRTAPVRIPTEEWHYADNYAKNIVDTLCEFL
jgi:hypothetical protein